MRPYWNRLGLSCNMVGSYKKEKFGHGKHIQENATWRWRQRLEWCFCQPMSAKDCQQTTWIQMEPMLSACRRNWPYWYLNLGLLPPQYVSVMSLSLWNFVMEALANEHTTHLFCFNKEKWPWRSRFSGCCFDLTVFYAKYINLASNG